MNLDLNLSQPVDEPTAQPVERPSVEEVIIIGSGPAGLSAAIYTARAALNPLLIAGGELGGQVATTTDVENYPGFPEMVTGPELYERMQQQAVKFGTAIVQDLVAGLVVDQWPFRVTTVGGQTYRTKSLIIASGASPRKMGVDGEQRLTGRGVSYCATCDGFFFRGKELAVVGGGDSALQEAIFLTKFATKVHVLHRRGQLRASVALQQRAAKNPKIDYVWNTQVVAANGENKLSSLTLRDSITGAERDFPVDGVFAYIGHFPNNQFFLGKLATDEHGYLLTDKLMRTNVPGIFAAGEIQDPRFRQVATSVGQGVAAALEVEKWLAERESLPEAEMVR